MPLATATAWGTSQNVRIPASNRLTYGPPEIQVERSASATYSDSEPQRVGVAQGIMFGDKVQIPHFTLRVPTGLSG